MMFDEAPASPRSAALYYWGGDWGGEEEKEEAQYNATGDKHGFDANQSWDDEKEDEYANLYESTFQKRNSFQLRHRPTAAVKFSLTLHDEGDADHWMYAPPPPFSVPDSSPSEEGKDEEHEEEVLIQESVPLENNDFADPNVKGDDFNSIPIIDLSQPEHIYAAQIGDACRNVGFFYIINHGVDKEVMNGVMDKSQDFFGLDLESKLKASNVNVKGGGKKGYRGYFGIGGEDLDNKDGTRDLDAEEGAISEKDATNKKQVTGDFKEGFDCGLESINGDDNDARIKFFGKNLWPDELNNPSSSGFRETLMKYQAELIGLCDKLLMALGASLNINPNGGELMVAEDYFIERSRNPMCTLRLLHYPPTNGDNASQGCGAHTDYGLFTILQQDSIGGLQVRNRNKHWIDAKPLKGSFVINVGDMLSHWTNGEYASTVHRVVSPSTSGHRYSVPFFFNPDHDAVVEPLESVGYVDQSTNTGGNVEGGKNGSMALEILKQRYEGTFQKSE